MKIKKWLNNTTLKKVGMLTATLVGFFLLFMIIYLFVVANHVSQIMDIDEKIAFESRVKQKSIIESDALIERADLDFFIPFTEQDQLKENKLDTLISSEGTSGLEYLTRSLELGPILKNDCERVYCFQHRASFAQIPPNLWKGLIGIEDIRFLEHPGIDFQSILRALIIDIKEMSFAQGGSTITQQLVKNLFFSNEKSLIRKLKEVVYALYLETKYEKSEILNAYFNEVFWGSLQGIQIKGFYAASLMYFQKKPEDLTDYEISILVSMLKGPYVYSPIKGPEKLRERADLIYKKLSQLKLIVYRLGVQWNDEQWERWLKKFDSFVPKKYFRAMWRTTVTESNILSPYEEFIFYTSVYKTIETLGKRVEGKDIAIKAMITNVECKEDCLKEFSYYSKIERDKETAITSERHQVGSIFKPLFYQIILNNGKKLNDLVSTDPITLNLKSGKWTPKDASRSKREEITVLEALRKSRNIPLIRLSAEVGFQTIENTALLFIPQLKTPLAEYPSQMLGAIELSVEEVSATYRQYVQTECLKIQMGEYEFKDSLMHLLSIHDETTIRRVVDNQLRHIPFFGKTGTSNNGLDNWYVAYDGRWVYAIWFGLEGNREGQRMYLSGASSSFRIFQNFLERRGKRFVLLGCPSEEIPENFQGQ